MVDTPTLSAKQLVTELVMQTGLRDAMQDMMIMAMESLEEGNVQAASFFINVAANHQKSLWETETKLRLFFT